MAERLEFDTGTQIEQFYNWMERNKLSANEISLWYALLHITNETGKLVWLSIAITRLEKLTGMKKDAIYKARDSLEEKGRIKYQEGKGSRAAQYSLTPFQEWKNYEEYMEPEEIEIETEIEPPEEITEEIPGNEPRVQIFRRMQELIPFPPSRDVEEIKTLLDEGVEDKLLCEAVDLVLTSDQMEGKPPMERWRYFKGILRSWRNNQIRTYEEYQEHEKQREEMIRNGGNRQSNRPIPDTEPGPEPNGGMREFRIPE